MHGSGFRGRCSYLGEGAELLVELLGRCLPSVAINLTWCLVFGLWGLGD